MLRSLALLRETWGPTSNPTTFPRTSHKQLCRATPYTMHGYRLQGHIQASDLHTHCHPETRILNPKPQTLDPPRHRETASKIAKIPDEAAGC